MDSIEKISRILRADKDVVEELMAKAGSVTGKKNVADKIIEENKTLIEKHLQFKEFNSNLRAEEIYRALVDKIKYDDFQLFRAMGKPSMMIKEDVDGILDNVQKIVSPENKEGFFLKKEKAAELVKKNPPQKVISYLGYGSVEDLLSREDIFEIFAAIRLFEKKEWFNDIFAKEYLNLTPDDFEKREVVFKSLNQKWVGVAQSFLKKKYQNISHLKELGYIFVVPVELGLAGETTRVVSLALHYFYEVKFYSGLFKFFSEDIGTFGKNLVSALKVDYIEERLPESQKLRFLILPSYLAKYDENDWRLAEPHISSEVLFWKRAENSLKGLNNLFKDKGVNVDFDFWQNLDWVGDYFQTAAGIEVLVSFNFVDTTMSLMKEKELIKYLYHHQESLWNKIFSEYFGEEKIEELAQRNIIKGYFEL